MSGFFGAELTFSDAKAIAEQIPTATKVDPRVIRTADLAFGKKTFSCPMIMGITDKFIETMNWPIRRGRFISAADVAARKKVCCLGKKTARELFGEINPVGEKVKMDGGTFLVVGEMGERGTLFTFDYDEIAMIPITAAEDLFHLSRLMEIGLVASDEKDIAKTVADITKLLIKRHGREDFRIDTQAESLAMLDSIMNMLTAVVAAIAAISLIVGGIGIMNIMLVSVAERTREIGLRKAVGARSIDIVMQFLVEAVIISLTGGALGLLLGIGSSFVFLSLVGLPLRLSYAAILAAVLVAVGVGVFSGVYPAYRAGKLDPIEALRYE
jgi:putative ABC transport system permease protein